ncbi:MAG TPA: 7-carboxy-7-deazaguanine synthase, partial [Sphingomonas sp.]|nr:7-carboxy-7-deazaguanine synthase [Sphingomonas sp.]
EEDRAEADCTFCDTDFVGTNGDGGGRYADAAALTAKVVETWGLGIEEAAPNSRFVVLTGGEPMLQVDEALIDALHTEDFTIAIETNGTIPVPETIDWITVSPKAGTEVVQCSGNELKLIWPQPGSNPDEMEAWAFDHHLVQPLDGTSLNDNRMAAIKFVIQHPRWRLSLQTHKLIGLR